MNYRWVVWCTLGSLAVGCGGTEKESGRPRYSDPKEIVTSLDRKGAELRLGADLRVRIPEDALREPVDVRITRARPRELQADESDLRLVSDRVRFEPHGLRFERDVEIELRVQDDDVPDEALGMRRLDDEKDSTWEGVADVRLIKGEDPADLRDLPAAERELRVSRRVQTRTRRFSLYAATEERGLLDGGPPECPDGYQLDGDAGCAPTLTGLMLSNGTLSPALSDEVTSYSVEVGLSTQTLTLTPTVPQDATLTIEGEEVTSGAAWQSVLDLGTNELMLEVSEAGRPSSRYTLTVVRGSQEAYLKASNAGTGDELGISVALSGDTLAVGARHEDSNATGVNGDQDDDSTRNSGAVYVFVRNDGTWTQQAYLKASNTGADDWFGTSVALSGDTLVVGAYGENSGATGIDGDQADDSANDSGAAYVFVRDDDTWTQQAYLKASNADAGDWFGTSVALSGDTLVVGASLEDSNATDIDDNQDDNSAENSGAAYVFVQSGDTWIQQAYLKASNTGAEDQFGTSVALSGDTLVVGALQEDSSATGINGDQADDSANDSGAVYAFVRSADDAWTQQAYLKAGNTEAGDLFGASLALSGDTLAVGAYEEDSSATGVDGNQNDNDAVNSGAAYVFTHSGSTWAEEAYLKASNTGASDWFGYSVALSGDNLVVGALQEDSSATGIHGNQDDNSAADSGAAYVFVRSESTWIQRGYLKASNTDGDAETSDLFGASLTLSGDTLVAGAPFEDSNATGIDDDQDDNSAADSGAAYVFR